MRRCIPADKTAVRGKALALILSLAMLASGLYAGPVFAAEDTDAADMDGNTEYVEPAVPQNTEEEPQPQPEDPSARLMSADKWNQTIQVVAELSESEQTPLKPDANGIYTLKFTTDALRATRTIKILISSPAECELSYSKQDVLSNMGGSFLETELTGQAISDVEPIELMQDTAAADGEEVPEAEPLPEAAESGEEPAPEPLDPSEDPDAVQVTEITVRINGTGEASINFVSKEGADYDPADWEILIRQTRPTSVISRTASVRTKTGTPRTIPRTYKEKYFKIIRKDENTESAVYKYRTVTGAFELKRASGISEDGYRANQGGGCDGTYSYNALCKKGSKTYAKIIKTRLSDMKVVKVSKDLKLNHANDITYDPVNRRLVVTHNDVKRKRVTFVDTTTLKSLGYKDIKIPETLKGATKSQMSAIKGFASVTYMNGGKYEGKYIGIISGNHNFLVMDQNFKPIEYITVNKKINGSQIYYQGADNMDDKLYVAIYPRKKSRRDFIVAYDMDGNFLGKVNLLKGYETENIFHAGDWQYMTLYKPVTKVWYTPKVVKEKVKLTKKERKLAKPNKKGKKPKYKTVIKIVKVKHTKSVKRSYIFRMNKVTL